MNKDLKLRKEVMLISRDLEEKPFLVKAASVKVLYIPNTQITARKPEELKPRECRRHEVDNRDLKTDKDWLFLSAMMGFQGKYFDCCGENIQVKDHRDHKSCHSKKIIITGGVKH